MEFTCSQTKCTFSPCSFSLPKINKQKNKFFKKGILTGLLMYEQPESYWQLMSFQSFCQYMLSLLHTDWKGFLISVASQSAHSGILLSQQSFPYQKVTFTLQLCLLYGCEISRCSGLLKHTHSLPCLRKIILIFHGVLYFIIGYLCDEPFSFLIMMSSEFPFCSYRQKKLIKSYCYKLKNN